MITGIAHVAFRVTDFEPALDFYCTKLGFREAFRLEREGETSPWIVYIQVAAGCFLELFPGAREVESTPDRVAGYDHFSLSVDDMKATLRALIDRGVPVNEAPSMGLDGNWQYWLTDPDGNRIELMQIVPESPQAAAEAGWGSN